MTENGCTRTPFRSYDARSGRWRSHDPIFQPWESTYLGMGGNPAMMVDPWGLKGTGLTYQKSAASPLSAAQYGTRGIPFFGSTPRSDQTNVAINYARDTQKTAPSQESRTSQALQKRQAERNSKKKNKKRKPRNNVEEFEAGVEAGFEGEINSGLDAVAVIPEMLTDATIEIANNSDLLLEIVLETGAGAALSLGEELVDVVNPIGYILDSPYKNGQKFGSLMGKFVVALYTGGLAIIARVALQMPKLAKLATAARRLAIEIEPKVVKQMVARGWTEDLIESTVNNPVRTVTTRDIRFKSDASGRVDDPATAYYSRNGGYVVRNDRTGAVVQISDRTDANWKAPWD